MELLPDMFIKVKKDIEQGRDDMADKVIGKSQELQEVMVKFEDAYIDNFHRRGSTKKPKDVLHSVQMKGKTLEDINMRVDIFKQSLEFLHKEGHRRAKEAYPDLEKYECYISNKRLQSMHEVTLKAWEFMTQWNDRFNKIGQESIKNIGEFHHLLSRTNSEEH